MSTAGIVAEYNPFHNGHKYQIQATRQAGAEGIVAVMSGDCVQRGSAAVFSKYDRAQAAIRNGADLVVELPCPFSCSNSEVFARSAVRLLAGLGEDVVTTLSFGCESGDRNALEQAAEISAMLENSQQVRELLSQGKSYPQAMYEASIGLYGRTAEEIFSTPNNVLAVEYIKAAKRIAPWLVPYAVKREAVAHDSQAESGDFASASHIRELIKEGGEWQKFVPYDFEGCKPSFTRQAGREMLFKLCTASREDFLALPDCDEHLANRFMSVVSSCPETMDIFEQRIKSKNITMARVRRMVLHLVLGIRKDDIRQVPYGRILAFNRTGTRILAQAENRTLEYDTSLKKLEDISDYAKRVAFLEKNAVRLRETAAYGRCISNEYTRKITIT